MGTRNPLDRSAAHEALLYTCDEFAKADMFRGGEIITEFLEAFYASPSLNMYDFAKSWAQEREEHAPRPNEPRGDRAQSGPLPPPPARSGHARAEARGGLVRVRKSR